MALSCVITYLTSWWLLSLASCTPATPRAGVTSGLVKVLVKRMRMARWRRKTKLRRNSLTFVQTDRNHVFVTISVTSDD